MGGAVESWGVVDDRESIAAIHQAIDLGLNLIDTAPIYGLGHSEAIVGKAIQGRRGEVMLATKCGQLSPTSSDQPPRRCLRPESVIRECEASLRRLRTDTIDLYQCHWPDPTTHIRDTMTALRSLLDQGKIRAIGLSNYSCDQIAAAMEFGPVHAVQPSFSMLHHRAIDDLFPFCLEHGLGVLPYSPLAKGLLCGRFTPESTFTGVRARDPDFIGDRYRRNLAVVDELRPIAETYGKTLTQFVINWTINVAGVTAPIVGAKRSSHVIEVHGALGWEISADDRRRIDVILQGATA
jgi:aryl-alcohol dehydrogenase-like predicted oxidoreductase